MTAPQAPGAAFAEHENAVLADVTARVREQLGAIGSVSNTDWHSSASRAFDTRLDDLQSALYEVLGALDVALAQPGPVPVSSGAGAGR